MLIGNRSSHPLPRGGTDLIASNRLSYYQPTIHNASKLFAWIDQNGGVRVGRGIATLVSTDLAGSVREYCLIVEGAYLSESEAEHALRDPFIEDWVEQTGHFKIHNMKEILITPGVTLGSLGVVMLDERVFEIAAIDPEHPLSEFKAKGVAEALKRQDMFEEIKVEPRDEALESSL